MINSFNEWDPLKKIVVGDASYANWPTADPVFALESTKTLWKETPVPSGPVPDWIIEETNEDLQSLVNVLTTLGVEVVRPTKFDFQQHGAMYNYCPRDRLIIHGSTVIDPAMMYPCRDIEVDFLKHAVTGAGKVIQMPRDSGMVLDAANVLRLGKDKLLFLESSSGNRAAYNWLQEQLPTVDIEICNFYSGVHIDSTIAPLREGLVLVNAARVTKETLPVCFKDWEIIWVDRVVEQSFYQYPYASKWIALNMLVVNPSTVIVDKSQIELIRLIESHKFNVIPLELRHSRTLGGGFHCVTLDTRRIHA